MKNGMLYAVDASSGAMRWSFSTENEAASLRDSKQPKKVSGLFSPTVVSCSRTKTRWKNLVLVSGSSSTLWAVEDLGDRPKKAWVYDADPVRRRPDPLSPYLPTYLPPRPSLPPSLC